MSDRFSQLQTQTIQQTQVQTMAPQQLLYVRLLELPVSDLEMRVKNEMDSNEALDSATNEEETASEGFDGENDEDPGNSFTSKEDYDKEREKDYADPDDIPEDVNSGMYNEVRERVEVPIGYSESFFELLKAQIGDYDVTDKQRHIIEYLIGSLDNDGLLRKNIYTITDELALYQNLEATDDEVTDALKILQQFEPAGIAATSLKESLELQLDRKEVQSKEVLLAKKIVANSFEDFTHKRKDKLAERYHLSPEELERVLGILRKLNPRPGSGLNDSSAGNMQVVIPDFTVTQSDDGDFEITLNKGQVPSLRVSKAYRESLDEYTRNRAKLSRKQKDDFIYMKQKVDAAQGFIHAIMQRRETLMKTMQAIVELQRPFFEVGNEILLRPMILKDVAQKTGLDVSTISRVSNSKYVSTDYGVYPLKYFFSDKFVTQSGEELSKPEIKNKMKELIEGEDKQQPLPDETLAQKLKEAGFPLARRTVAKYREQLGFPVARLRRQ